MIETLILVLIILLAFGMVIWAIATYSPLGQPFTGILIIIVALIGLVVILYRLGVINV